MELIRRIKFQNRIGILILTLMEDEWVITENLNEQKDLSDMGIESQTFKYMQKLTILKSRMDRLEQLEKDGPSERFVRKPTGIPWDIPANWINMSLTEMLWCKIRNGGVLDAMKRVSVSGMEHGNQDGATIALMLLSLTSPIWIWFPLYKERKIWRDKVAGEQVKFKVNYNV